MELDVGIRSVVDSNCGGCCSNDRHHNHPVCRMPDKMACRASRMRRFFNAENKGGFPLLYIPCPRVIGRN